MTDDFWAPFSEADERTSTSTTGSDIAMLPSLLQVLYSVLFGVPARWLVRFADAVDEPWVVEDPLLTD